MIKQSAGWCKLKGVVQGWYREWCRGCRRPALPAPSRASHVRCREVQGVQAPLRNVMSLCFVMVFHVRGYLSLSYPRWLSTNVL